MQSIENIPDTAPVGWLYGYLFFLHEECRLLRASSFDHISILLKKYGAKFKDVTTEMFFKAETASHKYYDTEMFGELCRKCIDFTGCPDGPPPVYIH